MGIIDRLKSSWRPAVVVMTPILLCPFIIGNTTSSEAKCAFMLLLCSTYWITEALPLPVTGLLPVALCPLLGIMSSKTACKYFFGDAHFLILGGIMVAVAIEESGLHKRFALKILISIGVRPRRLLLGLMLTTGFLSMWISNTASTAMMTPIMRALLAKLFHSKQQLEKLESHDKNMDLPDGNIATELTHLSKEEVGDNGIKSSDCAIDKPQLAQDELPPYTDDDTADDPEKVFAYLPPDSRRILKVFSLCICYSANIGGIGTLTGTPTNVVLAETVLKLSGMSGVTYSNWFMFGFPVALVTMVLCNIWLNIYAFGFWNTITLKAQATPTEVERLEEIVKNQYRSLGKIKFQEKIVLVHFMLLVLLWLTRQPGSVDGWATLLPGGFVTDGATAMAVGISLFILPNQRPNVLFFRAEEDTSARKSMQSILTWKSFSRKFPWGPMFLVGGGIVIAKATSTSGLDKVIGQHLNFLENIPVWAASLAVAAMIAFVTEITSNMVICLLMLPILANIAVSISVHPLYLMLPATVAASLAFMFPVATPPNALVFGFGDVKIPDMMKCGLAVNIIGVAVTTLATNLWGYSIYGLGEFPPQWASVSAVAYNSSETLVLANNTGSLHLSNDTLSDLAPNSTYF